MKVSFICTIFNEERTIGEFLDSLSRQSREPDEIVVVDGGSVDGTVDRVEDRRRKTEDRRQKTENGGQKFKIIERKEFNRSQGRNEAIRVADGDIIAVSDGGCLLDKRWLEEMVKPFDGNGGDMGDKGDKGNKRVEVVGGFYLPTGDSILQKILGQLTSVHLENINAKTFLPSSRSIAFKKSAWKAIGGYPEDLKYNEDIVFAQSLKKNDFKFTFAPKAVVEWPQRKNISEAVKQFFFYAVGDGMAKGRGPHYKKLFSKSLITIGLLGCLGSLGYIGWELGGLGILVYFGIKSGLLTRKIKNFRVFPLALIILPILNLAVLVGFGYGVIKGWLKEHKGE